MKVIRVPTESVGALIGLKGDKMKDTSTRTGSEITLIRAGLQKSSSLILITNLILAYLKHVFDAGLRLS